MPRASGKPHSPADTRDELAGSPLNPACADHCTALRLHGIAHARLAVAIGIFGIGIRKLVTTLQPLVPGVGSLVPGVHLLVIAFRLLNIAHGLLNIAHGFLNIAHELLNIARGYYNIVIIPLNTAQYFLSIAQKSHENGQFHPVIHQT